MSIILRSFFLLLGLISSYGLSLPAQSDSTILVIGDSLSSAYGIHPNEGWVVLLSQRLKNQKIPYQVVNISMGGDTTSQGLEKLPSALQQYHPKIVIIALGANDGLRGLPIAHMRQNLEGLITLSQQNDAKVLLVGLLIPVNYGPQYRKQFEEIYQKLAKQHKIIFVPFLLKDIALNPAFMQNDGLHPNALGQPMILDNIWPYLKKLLS